MNKAALFGIIIAIAVAGVTFVVFLHNPAHAGAATGARVTTSIIQQSAAQSQQPNATQKVLFSSTPYYPYAYLISTPNLSSGAKAALSGFKLSNSQNANGTSTYTITLASSGASQVVTLGNGYSLYVIETSYGDDGIGGDYSLADDGFVVVNQSGYLS